MLFSSGYERTKIMMNSFDLHDFIRMHLRFGKHWNKKNIGIGDAKWQELKEDTWLGGYEYAKGSQFKVFETTNFGWVVFRPDTKTPTGQIPGRKILKW
jgi:hypothetical protein